MRGVQDGFFYSYNFLLTNGIGCGEGEKGKVPEKVQKYDFPARVERKKIMR